MRTTEAAGTSRERVVLFAVLGLGAILAVVALVAWNRTPQLGTDEDVFRTVDALFTAVTARDEKLLSQCEQRLKAHRAAGKLPADAGDALDRIVAKARSGSWEAAAERLYDFMKSQKREGAAEPPPPRKQPPKQRGKVTPNRAEPSLPPTRRTEVRRPPPSRGRSPHFSAAGGGNGYESTRPRISRSRLCKEAGKPGRGARMRRAEPSFCSIPIASMWRSAVPNAWQLWCTARSCWMALGPRLMTFAGSISSPMPRPWALRRGSASVRYEGIPQGGIQLHRAKGFEQIKL